MTKEQVVKEIMESMGPVKCPVCGQMDCQEYEQTGNCSQIPWKGGYKG